MICVNVCGHPTPYPFVILVFLTLPQYICFGWSPLGHLQRGPSNCSQMFRPRDPDIFCPPMSCIKRPQTSPDVWIPTNTNQTWVALGKSEQFAWPTVSWITCPHIYFFPLGLPSPPHCLDLMHTVGWPAPLLLEVCVLMYGIGVAISNSACMLGLGIFSKWSCSKYTKITLNPSMV